MGQREQFPPAMPSIQAVGGILPQAQQHRAMADLGTDRGQGLDHVGRPGSPDLSFIDSQIRIGRQRQLQHGQAMIRFGTGLIAVRGLTGRQQTEIIDTELLAGLRGRAQMAVMNRIESAAKHGGRRSHAAQ